MSEQILNGNPRQILGGNSGSCSTDILPTSNATLNLHHQQQQNPACSGGESAKYSNLTFNNTVTTLLQQQQMDRLRLPLMSQDMHATIWPYGTILSPMMPAHNMALPSYALGTVPYAAVPIYQSLGPQQCASSPVSTSSSSSAASQRSNMPSLRSNLPLPSATTPTTTGGSASGCNNLSANHNSNNSNKINIQIGLQCVSQNNPMHFNSMNDPLTKVNLMNFCNPACHMGEKDIKARQILGGNSGSCSTDILPTSNATLNLHHQQQQNPACSGGESAKYSNLTFNNTVTTLLQQQQMDRLRLPLMSQDMHATIWPYGTILSPMMPAHNMALPSYALGTVPYAAVPIYQSLGPQQCASSPVSTSSSSSAASQRSNMPSLRSNLPLPSATTPTTTGGSASGCNNLSANHNSNNSNKINIQIGLQCVSQNNPMHFNSMNDPLTKVNLMNFCNPACHMGEKDIKESTSSLRNSPILLSPGESAAGGDATNVIYTGANGHSTNGDTVVLSQTKFNELTRLALRGSEIAEKLAYTHRNRPCFKKIDSLCARMKQDLIRPDGVLPNINSQGIAWAVKDFIFVFTRVINAWIIIKGYVYNTPEGLNKVKAALSPDFAASFAAWQDTTMDFIENLIKSFVNLDNLVQSQKNVYQKSDITLTRNSQSSTPIKLLPNALLDDSFDFLNNSCDKSNQNTLNKNYIYTMVEDSEGSQRQATVNGTYFKTGTYNPIKKDYLITDQPPTATNNFIGMGSTSSNIVSPEAVPHLLATPLEQYFDEQISGYWPPSAEIGSPAAAAATETAPDDKMEYLKQNEKIPSNWLNYDLHVLEQNLTEFCNDHNPVAPPKPLGKDLVDKLNIMIERLMSMKNADMFFKSQFTNNYFPDFQTKYKHEFMDIRSIIFKCQVGGYQSVFEMVHDVKKIIYSGKEFLKIARSIVRSEGLDTFIVFLELV